MVVAHFKIHLLGNTNEKQENSHSGDLVTRSFKLRPPDHDTEILTIRTSPPTTIVLQV